MAIVRYDPFRDLVTTQQDFSRLFNEFFPRRVSGEEVSTYTWAPAIDIYEKGGALVLQADLPGVDPKDVEIRIEDGTLYLKGERKKGKEVKEENYHRVERCYGSFARSFSLPASIDEAKIKAEYKDGQLTLTMPKREEARPKTIKISPVTAA